MSTTLVVTWRARAGEEERVAEALRHMVPATQAEPGCEHYYAHRSRDDGRDFILYERYRDEAAFQAHQETEHFQRWVVGEAIPRLERRVRSFYEDL
jgi:quinol monooxygenase YgiN